MPSQLRALQSTRTQEALLPIHILFTDPVQTASALREAASLANGLAVSIQIVAARAVPYPLPLTRPEIPVAFLEQQIAAVAMAAGVTASVRVYYCRDREETLLKLLPEHSVVVMTCRRTWLPTQESRLARLLRRNGHEVVLANPK